MTGRPRQGHVRALPIIEALDEELERLGGGIVTTEQFAVPQDVVAGDNCPGNNMYLRPAGGSEGYGVGAPIGAKLAAPDKPVVGLVGDGSLYYADSGLWTAVHHNIPVLYLITNNQSYGIVAGAFGRADGNMRESGDYGGVALTGMDPTRIAEGFGMEAVDLTDESKANDTIAEGLRIVENERRPFLINAHMPMGLAGRRTPGAAVQVRGLTRRQIRNAAMGKARVQPAGHTRMAGQEGQ